MEARYRDGVTVEWGGPRSAPRPEEAEIAGALDTLCPGLDYWLHEDSDGTTWMMISLDIVRDGRIMAVPRIDIDATGRDVA